MSKVLFTTYDGLTDNLGQSQIIPYLIGLAKKGFQISVLSCEKKSNFERNERSVRALLEQHHIVWYYIFYTKKPPVLSTIFDLFKMYFLGRRILKNNSFSIIHSRSVISGLVGFRLKQQFNTQYVFDMRGYWADERVESGMWNLANPLYKLIYRYFKNAEREMITQADFIISLTEESRRFIQTQMGIARPSVPVEVIPCCADLKVFSPNSVDKALQHQLRNKFGLSEEQFVLSYLGSIGTWYMLEEMLDFFRCLLEKLPDAKFLFITNEPPELILPKAVQRNISDSSLIIIPAKRTEVPTYLALSQWSIFFIKPVFSKSASSPTKQGEIMGMGIPHICNAGVGDIDDILNQSGAGILIREFSRQCYLNAIEKILSNNFNHDNASIIKSAHQFYSLEKGVELYNSVYRSVLSKNSTAKESSG